MKHLPVFVEVVNKIVLVVGGSPKAARRAAMAERAQAKVKVVSETLSPEFQDLNTFQHIAREFCSSDLEGAIIVYVSDFNKELEAQVSFEAQKRGVLINVADRPELSSFIMPSIIDRSPLVVGVSSGGEAPILARMLRSKLETFIPSGFGRLVEFARLYRGRLHSLISNSTLRRRFWEDFSDGIVAERVLSGQIDDGKEMMELILRERESNPSERPKGEVYLVGTGPGDPDLLTFRALRLMQKSDIVLHDRLVPNGILELVHRDAERLFVGKKRGDHAVPQEEISRLLVSFAKDGKRVLRLKGGDPFMFGRGGEEIEMLASKNIAFQVVPGISAGNGCAAYAGIPLTHRDHAHSCTFVTGHTKDGKLHINWKMMINPDQTIVVYMGLNSLPTFFELFIEHGGDPKMPAAVVDNGTRIRQRVVTGDVRTLPDIVEKASFEGPAIIIIGTVVRLREKLSWYQGSG